MKRCTRCGEVKDISFFHADKTNNYGYSTHCKTCKKIYYQSADGKYKEYKNGAKKRGYKFNLTKDQFKKFWQKPCYYCGDAIKTIGLDRVDNKIGYEVSNIVPCCSTCNGFKRGISVDLFLSNISKIYDNRLK